MEQITFNPNNEPYYSEDFIKGFKCGAERQFEADKSDANRLLAEWEEQSVFNNEDDTPIIPEWQSARCSLCHKYHTTPYIYYFNDYRFCPNCGAEMRKGKDDETD